MSGQSVRAGRFSIERIKSLNGVDEAGCSEWLRRALHPKSGSLNYATPPNAENGAPGRAFCASTDRRRRIDEILPSLVLTRASDGIILSAAKNRNRRANG